MSRSWHDPMTAQGDGCRSPTGSILSPGTQVRGVHSAHGHQEGSIAVATAGRALGHARRPTGLGGPPRGGRRRRVLRAGLGRVGRARRDADPGRRHPGPARADAASRSHGRSARPLAVRRGSARPARRHHPVAHHRDLRRHRVRHRGVGAGRQVPLRASSAPTSTPTTSSARTPPATRSCSRGCTSRSPTRSSPATPSGAEPIPGRGRRLRARVGDGRANSSASSRRRAPSRSCATSWPPSRDDGILKSDERVAEAVRFIRHPPLPKPMLPAYRVLFAGAVASLPDDYDGCWASDARGCPSCGRRPARSAPSTACSGGDRRRRMPPALAHRADHGPGSRSTAA